jgi:hypothetical protein
MDNKILYTAKLLNPRESGTLLIFKVKGRGHQVKFFFLSVCPSGLTSKSFVRFPPNSVEFKIMMCELCSIKDFIVHRFSRIKYVPSLVKIHWRMMILECSQGCYGRTVALLYPFATSSCLVLRVWNLIDFQGQRSRSLKFLLCNILVNPLESTSFNGFWPNLVHTCTNQ